MMLLPVLTEMASISPSVRSKRLDSMTVSLESVTKSEVPRRMVSQPFSGPAGRSTKWLSRMVCRLGQSPQTQTVTPEWFWFSKRQFSTVLSVP
jgi:hypothetical protein